MNWLNAPKLFLATLFRFPKARACCALSQKVEKSNFLSFVI